MRGLFLVALVAAAGLAGCVSSDTNTNPNDPALGYTPPAVPAVDSKELLALHEEFVVTHNERAANKATHESARVALLGYFESFGLETYRHNFNTTTLANQANIVGIKWGIDRTQWVIVGGHYDTITDDCLISKTPSPGGAPSVENPCVGRMLSQGAYDDGSGTMMTVHLAKAFSNITNYYTIAFVAFDGEELGTQGARAFVHDFITGGEDQVFPTPYGRIKAVGAVNLDMIGINWPGTWNPINAMTNSEALYAQVVNNTQAQGFPEQMVLRKDGLQLGSSDYARFWEVTPEQGGPIPTVFFISAFEEVAAPTNVPADVHTPPPAGVYPFWHLQDTVETMRTMAYDPPASGVAHPNLEAGFQSATELAAHMVHFLAAYPGQAIDAKVMS